MSDELKPCPFCGSGTTQFVENGRVWSGMKYTGPISVSVQHWCDPVPGQPSRGIERVGRDKASAIAMWNRRADDVADVLIGTREELAAEVARLRAMLSTAPAVPTGWVACSERLPDEGTHVLGYDASIGKQLTCFLWVGDYDNEATWRDIVGDPWPGITHWQALPTPPKGE